jgi:hypothetical protein
VYGTKNGVLKAKNPVVHILPKKSILSSLPHAYRIISCSCFLCDLLCNYSFLNFFHLLLWILSRRIPYSEEDGTCCHERITAHKSTATRYNNENDYSSCHLSLAMNNVIYLRGFSRT